MLLFLALMIVYIVRYQVKWSDVKKNPQSENSWSTIQILSKTWDDMATIRPVTTNQTTNTGTMTETWTNTWITKNTTWITIPQFTGTVKNTTGITLLSGTSVYYGSIAIIEKLWIKYQYALADENGTRYIYLGTPSYDFASIARALKGDLYTLATEQDILQNKLFGNKVVFINLPEYKDQRVLMLIYLNDGIWLIQIDYTLYHKSKTYLKSLFTD